MSRITQLTKSSFLCKRTILRGTRSSRLGGWEIGYESDDQHITELGVWLDNLRYDRPPGAPTGTLRYRVYSVVRDDDDEPPNYYNHKVTILGLAPLDGRGADQGRSQNR